MYQQSTRLIVTQFFLTQTTNMNLWCTVLLTVKGHKAVSQTCGPCASSFQVPITPRNLGVNRNLGVRSTIRNLCESTATIDLPVSFWFRAIVDNPGRDRTQVLRVVRNHSHHIATNLTVRSEGCKDDCTSHPLYIPFPAYICQVDMLHQLHVGLR
jgi:hypothetical protein